MIDDMSKERITVDPMGNMVVHGPDGDEWYTVSGDMADSGDYDLMIRLIPDEKPMRISDDNIEEWRDWAAKRSGTA